MSKILYVVFNSENIRKNKKQKILEICNNLNPDNITPNPTEVEAWKNIKYGINNPVQKFMQEEGSVLFGQAFGSVTNWSEVRGKVPDGNFALFRTNSTHLEVVSDVVGTKSIWYYKDEEKFIVSTSQRAIVDYIGNFEFNEDVIPWMLTNGILGPGNSWDTRLKLLEPDSSLLLNFSNWELKKEVQEPQFKANKCGIKENIQNLKSILNSTFKELNLDYSLWKLSLSGGYDSRGNLLLLPKEDTNGHKLRTLTWGRKDSENKQGSDAQVAQQLANKFNLPHSYLELEETDENFEIIFNRFLKNGEGRIDHIGGYLDGFKIWKKLFETGTGGIIRGDEVFGSYDYISEFHMKKFIGVSVYSDYQNLASIPYFQSLGQKLPDRYKRMEYESFAQWRDRLYETCYVPLRLSALSDLKENYVEQINPLLSRQIINAVRKLPDELRTDKKAWKSIVNQDSPNIPFANSSSTTSVQNVIKGKEVVDLIMLELTTDLAKEIFPEEFRSYLLNSLVPENTDKKMSADLFEKIKNLIPKTFKRKILKRTFTPNMDISVLNFRAFLILRMVKLFRQEQ